MSERVVKLAWRDASGTGAEKSRVTFADSSCSVDGVITGPAQTPFTVDYAVSCDEEWCTRYVFIADAASGRRLELLASGRGHWTDGDGETLHELRGALDVDISATPFTNTLPIRRLDLVLGESADIFTAFVIVPELVVSSERQRYTRVGPRTFLFQSLGLDAVSSATAEVEFEREITVDADGLVLDYPGLFARTR